MTLAQKATLKADILAKQASGQPLFGISNEAQIAAYYNAQAVPPFYAWRTTTPAADIGNAIVWSALTPVDTPDGTAIYTNRALLCQAKQINIQTLIQGRETVASNKASIRAGLQDALTNIPSGVGGVSTGGGWNAVKSVMTRTASMLEKLFAAGTGTAVSPADLGCEATLTDQMVSDIVAGL